MAERLGGRRGRVTWPLRIRPEYRERVERIAEAHVVHPSVVIERALDAYLPHFEDEHDALDAEILADRERR